jgi:hypothetical protein
MSLPEMIAGFLAAAGEIGRSVAGPVFVDFAGKPDSFDASRTSVSRQHRVFPDRTGEKMPSRPSFGMG